MMPKCVNFDKCGNDGFIYIYGKYYCGLCYKKYTDKLQSATEKMLIEE